jgi:hypothetical protein
MKKEDEHNSLYDEYQIKYRKGLEDNNKIESNKWLSRMYEVAKQCSRNYITKYCHRHGLNTYHFNIDDKAHDSAMFVIIQYLEKPNFRVNRISAYMHYGQLKVLFKDKDREMNEMSWDELIEKGK